jgi:hypothetical protein
VVNYNIGSQGQSSKQQKTKEKQVYSRSFIQEGDFDYHSDTSSEKKSDLDNQEPEIEVKVDSPIEQRRQDSQSNQHGSRQQPKQ